MMNSIGLQWVCTDQVTQVLSSSRHKHMSNDPITERIAFLRSIPLLQGLEDDELRFLAGEAKEREFEMGETIFYQGEVGYTCHIIIRGKARVYVVTEDGRELSVRILGPGEIFGEMALFEDVPRSASVEALEPTWTLELNQDVLLRALQRNPKLALSLLRALSARLRSTTEDAEKLVSMTVADRLMVRLERLAEWAGRQVSGGVCIALPMTQQELAALVGTSRESINRALSSLRRQGKLRVDDGWLVLLDEDK